jgi:hypothetical protein
MAGDQDPVCALKAAILKFASRSVTTAFGSKRQSISFRLFLPSLSFVRSGYKIGFTKYGGYLKSRGNCGRQRD